MASKPDDLAEHSTPSLASLPTLPGLPAVSSPVNTLPQERRVGVEFNGETRGLSLPTSSLEDFKKSLRDRLDISTSMTVTFLDPNLDTYVVLENIFDLPLEKAKLKVVTQARSWWGWSVDSSAWTTKGFETTRYSSLLVKEGIHIHHQPALDKFNLIATQLGFDPEVATKVFAISNEKLLINFENYHDTLYAKHRANPGLFKKEDWLTMSEGQQRKEFIKWHSQFSDRFLWNDKSKPRVIPMIQGTSEGAVWQICQQGFGVVGTTDDGFYGAGVYFTSKLGYASQYARSGPDGTWPVLVAMVIPGNTFPVVEHPFVQSIFLGQSPNPSGFKGKACRAGYQSHFTLVDGKNISTAFPIKGPIDPVTAADELVTFEGAQALPIFVFYTN